MNNLLFGLNNKNILIIGGSGFLGEQFTDAFLKEKANVFIIDIKKPKNSKFIKYFKANITKENELIKILNFFKKKKIKIDVLINNAAIYYIPKKTKKNHLRL